MDPFEQFKSTFLEESREYLDEIQQELAGLNPQDPDVESLHAIFRAVHSIKGGAGSFQFKHLVTFSHTFETTLDGLRSGDLAVSDEVVDVLLRASDILTILVDAAEDGTEPNLAEVSPVADALESIIGADPATGGDAPAPGEPEEPEEPAEPAPQPEETAGLNRFVIDFAPSSDMIRRANEPLLIIRQLKRIGAVVVTANTDAIPSIDDFDPLGVYVQWHIELETEEGVDAVEEAFEFLSEECDLRIEPVPVSAGDDQSGTAPDDEIEPDEFVFVPVRADVDGAPSPTETSAVSGEDEPDEFGFVPVKAEVASVAETENPSSETASEQPSADAPEPTKNANASSGPASGDTPSKAAASGERRGSMSIRVDLDKIDRLVNMVGELVIAQAMLGQQALEIPKKEFPNITTGLDSLGQTVRGLQESVMSIRAQPVKSVFSRMSRVVRDLCRDTGKEIRLETVGEETEVDKTVIEHLTDPLTHMIRNSADHGIESPDDRESAGKPRQGTIRLSARHRSGRVVIEIADDGAGINRERVLSKAIEKGLVADSTAISDEEIDNLIFAPGFSTAESVSNLSGRGVGMDVVRRNIQDLGGRVTVQSEPGKGSAVTMTLPLTLAVMDGMIVRVGREIYILPLISIVETVKPQPQEIHPLVNGSSVLSRRGEYTPLVQIRDIFEIDDAAEDPTDGLVVLVENDQGEKVGIVIDEMIGQQQVVLKSLEENYTAVDCVSAATILGDGQVALILDIAGMCETATRPPAGLSQAHGGAVA